MKLSTYISRVYGDCLSLSNHEQERIIDRMHERVSHIKTVQQVYQIRYARKDSDTE